MTRAALALCVALAGCAEPTVLLVFIDSDMPLERVTVEVTGSDGVLAPTATTMDFASADRPVRLTLVPDGTHGIGDSIEIEVKGYLPGAATESVERTAVTRFVDGETRFVQIYLFEVCAGFECAVPGETCVADEESRVGDCESESVNAPPYTADPAPIGDTPPPVCDATCWHVCPDEPDAVCEAPLALALGGGHSCARTREGNVYCWGDNDAGQLGHVSATGRPARVEGLSDVTSLAAGERHNCASDAQGRAFCWGFGMDAQLGRGVEPDGSAAPVRPDGLVEGDFVEQIGAGAITNCLVLTPAGGGAREVRCFGVNSHSSGGGARGLIESPTGAVMDVNDAVSVHPGRDHTCAVVDEGDFNEVVCWGWARLGRLGDGNIADEDELTGQPVLDNASRTPLSNVLQLAVGEQSACALIEDGATRRLRCWGPNEDRELGTGNGDTAAPFLWSETASVGPELPGMAEITGWTQVAMGLRQGCGVVDDAVRCWGWGNDGALGVGDEVDYATPTAVTNPEVDGVATLVALGGRRAHLDPTADITHACALIDGAIHCWGDNALGQLGLPGAGPLVTTPTRLGQ